MNTPVKYQHATWDDVPITIKETIRNNPEKGLYIHGDVGSGKTHIAHGIAHRSLTKENPLRVRFYNFTELLRIVRESYSQKFESYYENPLNMLLDFTGLLIVDDVGAEKATDWVQEKLYEIVNTRYEEQLITIFTSNLSIQELADRVGDRIVSRIVEMCSVIELRGEDRRMEKAEKIIVENNETNTQTSKVSNGK